LRATNAVFALVSWLASACTVPQGGTDVGNGVTGTVELDLRAYEQLPNQHTQSLPLQDGTRIDELWLGVDPIRLRPGTNCSDGDTEVDVKGPLIADLLGEGVLGGRASFPIK